MDTFPVHQGSSSAPEVRAAVPRGIFGLLYTSNPFYVISADLVFIGLRASFNSHGKMFNTWALLLGLACYTLLLATTAWLLIRFGRLWQDVRTVLLVIVLMFLATSVAIDDALIGKPGTGRMLCLGAFVFAAAVSEGLLRGIRLRLPMGFHVPYYLILALFFLYPVVLTAWMSAPQSEAMHWALFGFSPAAGLVFLTLIPAVRLGPGYISNNGSPWRWPLYPWVLFVFLALGVCGRAYYICISLHNVNGFQSIFGPYFLVPFLLALAAILLEIGLVVGNASVMRIALMAPLGLVALASIGHRHDLVYQRFLSMFHTDLGGTPLFLTLLALAAFELYALIRRVPQASEALDAVIAALVVVGPDTLGFRGLVAPQALPLLAIGILQFAQVVQARAAWRMLIATSCLSAAATIGLDPWRSQQTQGFLFSHFALLGVLCTAATCDDPLGRLLQQAGAALLAIAGLAAVLGDPWLLTGVPASMRFLYPLMLALVAVGYAACTGLRFYLLAAAVCLASWLSGAVGRGYGVLRQFVSGLDEIAWGLAFFALAALISLQKTGLLTEWRARLTEKPARSTEWD